MGLKRLAIKWSEKLRCTKCMRDVNETMRQKDRKHKRKTSGAERKEQNEFDVAAGGATRTSANTNIQRWNLVQNLQPPRQPAKRWMIIMLLRVESATTFITLHARAAADLAACVWVRVSVRNHNEQFQRWNYFDVLASKRHWNACKRESTRNGRQVEKTSWKKAHHRRAHDARWWRRRRRRRHDDGKLCAKAVPFDRSKTRAQHSFDSVNDERAAWLTHSHTRTLAHTHTGDLSLIIHFALHLNLSFFLCYFCSNVRFARFRRFPLPSPSARSTWCSGERTTAMHSHLHTYNIRTHAAASALWSNGILAIYCFIVASVKVHSHRQSRFVCGTHSRAQNTSEIYCMYVCVSDALILAFGSTVFYNT